MPSESQLKEFYSDRHLNKVERANNAIPYLVDRRVRINEKISCKEELRAECLSFPRGKHDDFVDTLVDGVKFVYGQKICSLEALDQLRGVLGGNPFGGLRF